MIQFYFSRAKALENADARNRMSDGSTIQPFKIILDQPPRMTHQEELAHLNSGHSAQIVDMDTRIDTHMRQGNIVAHAANSERNQDDGRSRVTLYEEGTGFPSETRLTLVTTFGEVTDLGRIYADIKGIDATAEAIAQTVSNTADIEGIEYPIA